MTQSFGKISSIWLIAGFTATVFGLCSGLHWIFEYFSHFRLHYLLGLVLLGLMYAVFRQHRLMSIALFAAGINLAALLPFLSITVSADAQSQNSKAIRVTSVNLNSRNYKLRDAQKALLNLDSDLIYILEITPAQTGKLDRLHAFYPHRLIEAREHSFGMAVFSRLPFETVTAVNLIDDFAPSISTRIRHEGTIINILAVHLYAPIYAKWLHKRNEQLNRVLAIVQDQGDEPKLLIGDLNISVYADTFRRFVRRSGLYAGAHLSGLYATWPGMLGPLGIPIDHALVSDDLFILRRQITHIPGSDHRAITVDIIPRQNNRLPADG